MSRHDAVLKWRIKLATGVDDESPPEDGIDLADSMSVERLPYSRIPDAMLQRVTNFRRLRFEERARVAMAFLRGGEDR